ncbi:MAG: hypothetical protein JOZ39_08470 [Chloroflexi bacterium]|nr:hypothetical protein [Chloroflexota bacterium]
MGIINDVFTPSAGDVERAQETLAAYEQAQASGSGAMRAGADFVDLAVVGRARNVIELANQLGVTR